MEKKFRITVDGRAYDVTVEDLSGGTSRLIPEPGDMSIPGPEAAETGAAPGAAPAAEAAAAGPGDEVSPLAGVVHSVDVTVGQDVSEGDKVATIEAMKMKTAVVAHRSGKVTNIAVKAGDPVDAGQPLLTIG